MKTLAMWLALALIMGGVAWAGDLGLNIDSGKNKDELEQLFIDGDITSDAKVDITIPTLDSYTFNYCGKEIEIDAAAIKRMTPQETDRFLQLIEFLLVQYNISNSHFAPLDGEFGCEVIKKMLPGWVQ
jgi:hypothetical protein